MTINNINLKFKSILYRFSMMVRCKKRKILILVLIVLAFAFLIHKFSDSYYVLTTGYCNCGICCGWERSNAGKGEPVYNYGPLKGRPKKVGITSSGTRAKHGTIAADPKFYRMGARLEIPGYGKGRVEDIGGAIKGRRHIDLWFPSHDEALHWGRRWLRIKHLTP